MSTPSRLDARYGRIGSGRRRAGWIVAGVVGAAAVIAIGWLTLANPSNGVRADGISFVLEERSVTVSFQLTAPAGTRVACAVEALDEEFGIVGWKVVEFPASGTFVRPFTQTVPILATATTGLVNSCWVT